MDCVVARDFAISKKKKKKLQWTESPKTKSNGINVAINWQIYDEIIDLRKT